MVKVGGSEFSQISADLDDSATTRGSTAQWSGQADSAHKTGLDSFFQVVLTLVESGTSGGTSGENKRTRDLQNWGRMSILRNNQTC